RTLKSRQNASLRREGHTQLIQCTTLCLLCPQGQDHDCFFTWNSSEAPAIRDISEVRIFESDVVLKLSSAVLRRTSPFHPDSGLLRPPPDHLRKLC
uniref:Uncharacterized protein n=1 Tax=Crocodylus porosus TaxID=8502 RepID=A0A7M4FGY3_CROPO